MVTGIIQNKVILLAKKDITDRIKKLIDGFNYCRKMRQESGWDENAIRSLKFYYGESEREQCK